VQREDTVTRAKEYAFLLYAMLLATVYAVAHDHVTATISPEYFLYGKGLAEAPQPFRWAVTLLAIGAGLAPGLLAGAALLLANNPRRIGHPPQLAYRALVRLSLLPVAAAGVLAVVGGVVNAYLQIGTTRAVALGVVPERVWRFVIVWAIHVGSYAGALLGCIAAAVLVVRLRGPSRSVGLAAALADAVTSRPPMLPSFRPKGRSCCSSTPTTARPLSRRSFRQPTARHVPS
jgi:hypothetical protein